MKRKLFLLMICIGLAKITLAQKDSLAVDEHGKLIYYKVVTTTGTNADVLFSRAVVYFKSAYAKSTLKLNTEDTKNASLNGTGLLMVTKKSTMANHPDGQISCKVYVEIKDNKYRYWFTDYVFTPYQRDRYDNYVPIVGQDIAMEKATQTNDKKDVDHYLDECARFAKQVGNKLQQYMAAPTIPKKDTVTKKVITINKW